MSRRKLIESSDYLPEQIQTDLWPTIDVLLLSDSQKSKFLMRKQAVEMYFENKHTQKEISEITGVKPKNLRRLIKRCLEACPEGSIWGFRGLIPQKNIQEYTKIKSVTGINDQKKTGEFRLLLNRYPSIKERIDNLYLGKLKKEIRGPVMSPKVIYGHFINECRTHNIKMSEYPFNTEDQGYRSLQRYLVKLREKNFGKASKRYGPDAANKAKNSGTFEQNEPQIIRPYSRIQFDAHRIDAVFAIQIRTLAGDVQWVVVERVWLLVFMDVATRNVLGHYISLNKEYTAADVMICARNAIRPKERLTLTIPGLSYQDSAGFPSEKFDCCKWAAWEACSFDNAKSNLSKLVKDRMENLIECNTNPGPVAMPLRRANIERLFGILESLGFHNLPNTTGSHFKDPRRNNPEKKAIQYYISLDHLEELMDVLIANYNGTPHGGIDNLRPLEVLEQRLMRGMIPKIVPENKRSELAFLQMNISATIRGDVKVGKRPHIYFAGEEYRNEILSQAGDLIGTKLNLHVNVDDLRSVKAFLPDGSEFGSLVAAGRWGLVPHSLKMRKEIKKLRKLRIIHYTEHDCPITVYQDYLATMAQKQKRNANKYAEVERQLKKSANENVQDHPVVDQSINLPSMEEEIYEIPKHFKTITF